MTRIAPESRNDGNEERSSAMDRRSGRSSRPKLNHLKLKAARVAGAQDRELMASTQKAQITTIKALGEGAFGVVDLVLVDTSNRPLLCVRKKLLAQTDHNINDPRLEVEFLDNLSQEPFVVQLWSHVVGVCDWTLLLEYCPYGSLEKLLQHISNARSVYSNGCMTCFSDRVLGRDRHAGFTETEARFYAACCILGLEAMHTRNILHRDIKPSNLLIAENGYVKLGDLGLCKKLGHDAVAHSTAGTPGYMAPEVCHPERRTNGYSYPADLWSLGILIWELVDGIPPRWAPMSWYLTPTLHFPQHFSPALQALLTGLLQKEPQDRFTLQDCKTHAWFSGIDWHELREQRVPAPKPAELERVHIHARLAAHTAAAARKAAA